MTETFCREPVDSRLLRHRNCTSSRRRSKKRGGDWDLSSSGSRANEAALPFDNQRIPAPHRCRPIGHGPVGQRPAPQYRSPIGLQRVDAEGGPRCLCQKRRWRWHQAAPDPGLQQKCGGRFGHLPFNLFRRDFRLHAVFGEDVQFVGRTFGAGGSRSTLGCRQRS